VLGLGFRVDSYLEHLPLQAAAEDDEGSQRTTVVVPQILCTNPGFGGR